MKNFSISLLVFFFFITTGCGEGEGIITPSPGDTSKALFQLTETEDNRVTEVDVLAFKVDENDLSKEYFAYRVQSNNILDDGAPNKKQFTITLKKGGESKYRFVVLANCRKIIDALGDINTSALKEDLLARLISHHEGMWLTDTNNPNYTDIPMWAESLQMSIVNDSQTISGLFLLRMLARIDVMLDTPAQNQFKLKSVRLYNYNTFGHIVPKTEASHWSGNEPTIPPFPGTTFGPIIYDEMSTPDISLIRGIYLYETAAVAQDESSKATCLVLGGEYNNEGKDSYYRVDFKNLVGSTYMNIIRNNLYNVRISNVTDSGHETPEEAFNSKSVSIESDITVWEQGALSDVIIDGSFRSTISQSEFRFPLDQRTAASDDNKLTLLTNYPEGWTVEKIVDEEDSFIGAQWLTLSRYVGAMNEETTISLLTDANITEVERTAFIHFKFGRIIYVVKVIQSTAPEINLTLKDDSGEEITHMFFYAHVGGSVPPQNLFVAWEPMLSDLNVLTSAVAETLPFDFGSGNQIITEVISDGTGAKAYVLQPPAITQAEIDLNPFVEKAVRVDYTVNSGASMISKILYLQQKNFAAIPTVEAEYLMNGTEQFFSIRSNAPWRIEIANDPDNVLQQLITTSGGLGGSGDDEKVFFRLINDMANPTILQSDVTLIIKSNNPLYPFPDIPVILNCTSKAPTFTVTCESVKVNGIYETNVPLNATNTITMNVNVSNIGFYSIKTQTVDGISFSATGEFVTTGLQAVTLQGSGTPSSVDTKMMELTINSTGGVSPGCAIPVRMIIPKKTILSLGSAGWAIHSPSGIANMFNNPLNFGQNINSTFKTYIPTVSPNPGSYMTGTITAAALQPYLEPTVGNPVDIIVMTYNADLGIAAAPMMANYVKRGGVLIMLNEHNRAAVSNFNCIKEIFNNDASIAGQDDQVGAGWVLKLPNNNDEILNGPFGDIRGKYIGEDAGSADVFTVLPLNELDWVVSSVDYSGTGGNASQIYAFKAKNYNFFWCGDGGMASGNGSSGFTTYPVTLTASPDYKPSSRSYGRNAGSRFLVDNATLFANLLAWGIQQAEFNGINTVKKNKTKSDRINTRAK